MTDTLPINCTGKVYLVCSSKLLLPVILGEAKADSDSSHVTSTVKSKGSEHALVCLLCATLLYLVLSMHWLSSGASQSGLIILTPVPAGVPQAGS